MSDDCVSTLPDVKQFDSVCDCDDCSDEREGFIDLRSIDSTNPSTTTTTMFNKTVAATIRRLITDISVDVTTTKVIKD